MKNLIYILLLGSIIGCVVPRNYPKAKWKVDKIVDKWPEVLQNDTIIIDSLIYVPGAEVDTIFRLRKNDTIVIEKEKLKIKFIRGKRDSIYLEAECEPDTIRIQIPVPVYSIDPENLRKPFNWYWVLAGGISLLLLYIIIITYKNYKKLNE